MEITMRARWGLSANEKKNWSVLLFMAHKTSRSLFPVAKRSVCGTLQEACAVT